MMLHNTFVKPAFKWIWTVRSRIIRTGHKWQAGLQRSCRTVQTSAASSDPRVQGPVHFCSSTQRCSCKAACIHLPHNALVMRSLRRDLEIWDVLFWILKQCRWRNDSDCELKVMMLICSEAVNVQSKQKSEGSHCDPLPLNSLSDTKIRCEVNWTPAEDTVCLARPHLNGAVHSSREEASSGDS